MSMHSELINNFSKIFVQLHRNVDTKGDKTKVKIKIKHPVSGIKGHHLSINVQIMIISN